MTKRRPDWPLMVFPASDDSAHLTGIELFLDGSVAQP
jgi:hypothetical protein